MNGLSLDITLRSQLKRFLRLPLSLLSFAVVAFFATTGQAYASTCSVPYNASNGISNGQAAQASQINSNFSALVTCGNNVDNTQIGSAGIYASQIIPSSGASATFGGSQMYAMPYGLTLGTSGSYDSNALDIGTGYGSYGLVQISNNAAYPINGINGDLIGVFSNGGTRYLALDHNGNISVPGGVYGGSSLTLGTNGGTIQTYLGTTSGYTNEPFTFNALINASNSGDWLHANSSGCTTENFFTSSGTGPQGVSTNGFGIYCNSGGATSLALDSSGDLGVSGNLYGTNISSSGLITASGAISGSSISVSGAASSGSITTGSVSSGAISASSTIKTTISSGAQSYVPATWNNNTQNSNFHEVLLSGTTSSGGCSGSPEGGSNCAKITLSSNEAFTGLSTFACTGVNEVDGSGTYHHTRNDGYVDSADGQNFYIQGSGSGLLVSSTCSGY